MNVYARTLLTDLTDPDVQWLLSQGEKPQSVHIIHGYRPNEVVQQGLELIRQALLKMIDEDQLKTSVAFKVVVGKDTDVALDQQTIILNLHYTNRNKVLTLKLSDDKASLYLH